MIALDASTLASWQAACALQGLELTESAAGGRTAYVLRRPGWEQVFEDGLRVAIFLSVLGLEVDLPLIPEANKAELRRMYGPLLERLRRLGFIHAAHGSLQ